MTHEVENRFRLAARESVRRTQSVWPLYGLCNSDQRRVDIRAVGVEGRQERADGEPASDGGGGEGGL